MISRARTHRNGTQKFDIRDAESFHTSSRPLFEALTNGVRIPPRIILLVGETGTGKGHFAHILHKHLRGASGLDPIFCVCPSLTPTLVESALFGHEANSFTGAASASPGFFASAGKGTLVLDEFTELPQEILKKLLGVLDSAGEYFPVGTTKPRIADPMIICTTNRDIVQEVDEGRFRRDLFERISPVMLRVLPLRERTHQIIPIAITLLRTHKDFKQTPGLSLSPQACKLLVAHSHPGNVRGLHNWLVRATTLDTNPVIQAKTLEQAAPAQCVGHKKAFLPRLTLDEIIEAAIIRALEETSYVVSRAARMLGISRGRCVTLIKRHGIPHRNYRPGDDALWDAFTRRSRE